MKAKLIAFLVWSIAIVSAEIMTLDNQPRQDINLLGALDGQDFVQA